MAVQILFGQAAAGGTADLDGLELLSVGDTAAHVKHDITQRRAHGDLNQTGVAHVAGKGERLGAGAFRRTDPPVPLRAALNDHGHVGVGLHVVEDRGLLPQAVLHSAGRLDAGHTSLALD